MARSKTYHISLTDDAHRKVLTYEQSAKTNCICMATVTNTVKLFSKKGIMPFCNNCQTLVDMFEDEFPNIKVTCAEVVR